MAATRLIALHINKGKTVAQCLADRTDYSQNAAKTENGKYISSYACDPRTADEEFMLTKRQYEHITGRRQGHNVIAYQIRQSFKPGEITPEEANKIGYELAMRWTKGNHAFIVCTHVDKAHIHNHIVYNSTSLDCQRKYRDFHLSGLALQKVSDLLCLQHGLSVIIPKPYREREKRTVYPRKKTLRDGLCEAIDAALLKKPKDFRELVQLLMAEGYEYKDGKHPAVRGKGQKRFIRFRSLGDGYTEDDLSAIIAGKREPVRKDRATKKSTQNHVTPKMQFLIDIQAKILEGKGGGYTRWATVFNLKQVAEAMFFAEAHGFGNLQGLAEATAERVVRCDTMLASIKADEERLQEIHVMKKHLMNYARAKDTFAQYKASRYSRKFFEEHREVLTLRRAAKTAFEEYKKAHPPAEGEKFVLPSSKELSAEYAEVLSRKKKTYSEYRKAKDEMQEYLVAKKILETVLGEETRKEEQRQQDEQNQEQNR